MIRKGIKSIGKMAVLNEFMLSDVRVNPRSLKAELAVKKAHHTRPWLAWSTIRPHVSVFLIHGRKHTRAKIWKPQ